jgi:hypothetical protein
MAPSIGVVVIVCNIVTLAVTALAILGVGLVGVLGAVGYVNLLNLHNTQQSTIAGLRSDIAALQAADDVFDASLVALEETTTGVQTNVTALQTTLDSCGVAEDECPWQNITESPISFYNMTDNFNLNITLETTYSDLELDNLVKMSFLRIDTWVFLTLRNSAPNTIHPIAGEGFIGGNLPASILPSMYLPANAASVGVRFTIHAKCNNGIFGPEVRLPLLVDMYDEGSIAIYFYPVNYTFDNTVADTLIWTDVCTNLIDVNGDYVYNIADVSTFDDVMAQPKAIPHKIRNEFVRRLGLSSVQNAQQAFLTKRRISPPVHPLPISLEKDPALPMLYSPEVEPQIMKW